MAIKTRKSGGMKKGRHSKKGAGFFSMKKKPKVYGSPNPHYDEIETMKRQIEQNIYTLNRLHKLRSKLSSSRREHKKRKVEEAIPKVVENIFVLKDELEKHDVNVDISNKGHKFKVNFL